VRVGRVKTCTAPLHCTRGTFHPPISRLARHSRSPRAHLSDHHATGSRRHGPREDPTDRSRRTTGIDDGLRPCDRRFHRVGKSADLSRGSRHDFRHHVGEEEADGHPPRVSSPGGPRCCDASDPAAVPKPSRTKTKSAGPKGAPAPKLKKPVSRVGLAAPAPKVATSPPVVLTPPVPNITDTDKLFGDASTSSSWMSSMNLR
jgi:hypothetical protein